jgi:hypothetical protein
MKRLFSLSGNPLNRKNVPAAYPDATIPILADRSMKRAILLGDIAASGVALKLLIIVQPKTTAKDIHMRESKKHITVSFIRKMDSLHSSVMNDGPLKFRFPISRNDKQRQDMQDARFSFLMVVPAIQHKALHRISTEMRFLCSLYRRIVLTKSSLRTWEYSEFSSRSSRIVSA